MHMKLAPQVIQSIEILQLPMVELKQRIEEELMENPMLEEEVSEKGEEGEKTESLENSEVEEPTEDVVDDVSVKGEEDAEQFDRLDDLASYYEEHSAGPPKVPAAAPGEKDAKLEAFDNSPAPDPTLEEHLLGQLAYQDIDEKLDGLCKNIIANLDERGYLAYPLEDIVKSMGDDVSLEDAERALKIVQGFEPPGVAARDIQECLLLQLDERGEDYDFVASIIRDYFDDVLNNRLPKIAQKTGRGIEEVSEAVEKIGKLNPRPGALFSNLSTPHIMPDLRIEERDGKYDIVLEETWLPSLRICAYYARKLQQEDLDEKTREYLRKKLQAARGIISAIEQRRATLESVTREIVRAQEEFFRKGEMYFKPLKMQDVADSVGVHVSTVSRAIAGKYAQTPQGIYSLKHFFTGGVRKDDGDMESWEVVRHKLQQIVANEDKSKPLSDEAIAEKLNEEGIDIARRTVSKYRKSLNIPSSRMRKEYG
jgi:RNA polymerase sigma-54 factor